jgi:hypothetical protein
MQLRPPLAPSSSSHSPWAFIHWSTEQYIALCQLCLSQLHQQFSTRGPGDIWQCLEIFLVVMTDRGATSI